MNAYQKEVWFTIIMSAIFLVVGHSGLLFAMFPTDAMLFGFPVMYIVPILSGWFGVLILTIIAGAIGNKIDEAIERENEMKRAEAAEQKSSKGVN
ncbi:hypothetical protein IRY55_10805 [Savagea sp. SN6]|uniref:Uncharacterized protein n=1 Tax=Savagea serpentis TaxID=2785297 RepID=A0A8J7G5P4_9BACL|nr:hypothetical protein [Savagea serpentis]MBF4501852.1 hypothetical protein [Savagea serpentis]